MPETLHTVLVPVYNSRDTLGTLVRRVAGAMQGAALPFELVLVDDGSGDGSFEEIRRLAAQHPFVRGFRLSRNFGHQAALTIGLQRSRGDVVCIIDDDLQDPPELLPEFIARLDQAEVVYGIRCRRKESLPRRTLYSLFYRLLRRLSAVDIPLDAGDFCVMKRCVVEAMLQFREVNPFLRGIRAWVGFRQVGVTYERQARAQGDPGYTLGKYVALAVAGVLSFSYVPLRLATFLGLASAGLGFLFAVYVVVLRIMHAIPVSGYASLVVVIAFLGGTQLMTIGVLGEYLARLCDNSRGRPVAVVAASTEAAVE